MFEELHMKTIRILSLFERLSHGQIINKKEEAKRFNVNEKTIQRDLEDLRTYFSEFKHNLAVESIVYERKHKGYSLKYNDYGSLAEKEILVLAKILLESRAFPKKELESILNKLIVQCPSESQKYVKDLLLNEIFHYVPLQHNQSLFQKLWDLSRGVKEKRVISIKYQRENESHPIWRTIEPLGIIFSEFYFYLIGYLSDYGQDMPIVYRLDRIQEYKVTKDRFTIPEAMRFEDGEFRKRVQFMTPGKLMKIKFRFSGPSLNAVLDRLPTCRIIQRDKNIAILEAEVYGKGIKMWLLSQGQHIEVLEPLDFRKEMSDTIASMMRNYSSFID